MSKVMIISGANKGIGYYLVKAWLEKGNTAIVLDVNCDEVNRLKDDFPQDLLTFLCDISNEMLVKECVEKAANVYGRIDVAVHNACMCVFKNIMEHSTDEFLHIYQVNLIGAVHMTKAVLPYMRKEKGGRICLVSSGVGVTGYVNISGYAASKGAIESFARCMSLENESYGISFHILHPPLTDTESSSPLPVPKEFKAKAATVGYGFAANIFEKRFIITPSLFDGFSVMMSYWFPRFLGKMLVKMTNRVS